MTSETPPSEKPKSNAGWNIHAVIDRLDTIALFVASSLIAICASIYYYRLELPDDKFLTFASFVSIIGVILFCYKWVQKQVLKGMTDNVMEAIKTGFEEQNKKLDKFGDKLDKFGERLDKFGSELSDVKSDVSNLRGRYGKEEKDSTKKTETDS
jgi:hypothetical protein